MQDLDPLQQIAAAHTPESLSPEEMPDEAGAVAADVVSENVDEQTLPKQDPRLHRIDDYAREGIKKQDHGDAVITCCNADMLEVSYLYHRAYKKALAAEGYALSAFEKHVSHIRELRKIDNLIRQTYEAERKQANRPQRDPLLQPMVTDPHR